MRVIAGRVKGARLEAKAPGVRPTSARVRSALFSALGPERLEGARVLDLYAGAGTMGIEALSRGAAFARFVERDRRQCAAIRKALRGAGLHEQAEVSCATVMKYLQATDETFDLAIADPPYTATEAEGALGAIAAAGIVPAGGRVVLEHAFRSPAPEPPGLQLLGSRRYGDTAVSFYEPCEGREAAGV